MSAAVSLRGGGLGGEIVMYMGRDSASLDKEKPAGCGGPLRIKGGLESRHHRCRRAAFGRVSPPPAQARVAAAAWLGAKDRGEDDRSLMALSIPIRGARVNCKVWRVSWGLTGRIEERWIPAWPGHAPGISGLR